MGIFSKLFKSDKAKAVKVAAEVASARDAYEALEYDPLRQEPMFKHGRTETDQVLPAYRRLKSYRIADGIYDNDVVGSIVDTVVRMSVGAHGGRPYFRGESQPVQSVWDRWASSAGFYEGEDFSEVLSTILRSVIVHGDCVVLADKKLTDGRIRVWDADQVTKIDDFDTFCLAHNWVPAKGDSYGWRQVEGVVTDPYGRVEGYFVTSLRQKATVPNEMATFLPVGSAIRVSDGKKLTQYRGESALLPMAQLIDDTRSLIRSEVAAAKNFSQMAFLVIRPPSGGGSALGAVLDEAIDPDTGEIRPEVADLLPSGGSDPRDLVRAASQPADLKMLSDKSAIGTLPYGSSVQNLTNSDRPASSIQAWMDKLADIAGQRLGVFSSLANARANASYSGAQLELAMSWRQIEIYQRIVRRVVDYAVSRVFGPGLDYVVRFPGALDWDPAKTQKAKTAALKSGDTTFQDAVGPEWRTNIRAMREFQEACREEGVDPSVYSWYGETISGAEKTSVIEAEQTTQEILPDA